MRPGSLRVEGHGLARGAELRFLLDGEVVTAYEGETVAAALLALGDARTRTTVHGSPRGIFCGIGVCFDCLVVVDGIPNTRACTTWVREGLDVRRQAGWGAEAAP